MFQTVNTYFEAALDQLGYEATVQDVVLQDEIETRAESVALIDLRQRTHERLALCPFNIVREDERKVSPVRPQANSTFIKT